MKKQRYHRCLLFSSIFIFTDDSFRATLQGSNFADVKLSNISRGLCFVIKVKIKKTREI